MASAAPSCGCCYWGFLPGPGRHCSAYRDGDCMLQNVIDVADVGERRAGSSPEGNGPCPGLRDADRRSPFSFVCPCSHRQPFLFLLTLARQHPPGVRDLAIRSASNRADTVQTAGSSLPFHTGGSCPGGSCPRRLEQQLPEIRGFPKRGFPRSVSVDGDARDEAGFQSLLFRRMPLPSPKRNFRKSRPLSVAAEGRRHNPDSLSAYGGMNMLMTSDGNCPSALWR